jgi:hypothetical protein
MNFKGRGRIRSRQNFRTTQHLHAGTELKLSFSGNIRSPGQHHACTEHVLQMRTRDTADHACFSPNLFSLGLSTVVLGQQINTHHVSQSITFAFRPNRCVMNTVRITAR